MKNRMKILFFIFLMTSSLSFAESDPQTLIGTWQLVSMKKQELSGEWVERCFSPSGLLTYTDAGYMAVGINCMKEENSKEPTTEMKDTIFYTGKYFVSGQEVVHQVMNSSDPIFFEKEIKRGFSFNEDGTITLEGKGKAALVRMVWKKISGF